LSKIGIFSVPTNAFSAFDHVLDQLSFKI
jgi:hypothetical protein